MERFKIPVDPIQTNTQIKSGFEKFVTRHIFVFCKERVMYWI